MPDYSMFVPNVHFELIPIKNLVSNQEYQRNLSLRHALRLGLSEAGVYDEVELTVDFECVDVLFLEEYADPSGFEDSYMRVCQYPR